jgi:hypothetical protein
VVLALDMGSAIRALESLFPEDEAKLHALFLEHLGQDAVAAVEHGDPALPLLPDLREHLVPVGPAGVGARLEASYKVAFLLK